MAKALLADIHGNIVALETVLTEIQAGWDVDEFIVAGDLVMGGPRPAEVLDRLRSGNFACVKGNTDDMVLEKVPKVMGTSPNYVASVSEWTAWKLDPDGVDFLEALPTKAVVDLGEIGTMLVVHSLPGDYSTFLSPTKTLRELEELFEGIEQTIVGRGHDHHPFVRELSGLTLVTTGSVGMPLDGDPRASFTILDWVGNRLKVIQRRVPYDIEKVVKDMRQVGQPDAAKRAEILRRAKA